MNKFSEITNILCFCLVVLIITSCDPGTDYTKKVINQSTKQITLLIDKNYNGSKLDTIIIKEGGYYVVDAGTELGFSEERYSDCNRGFPLYFINPLDFSKVNISNSQSWIYQHAKKGKEHIVTCSYVIKDESFIKE